MFDGLQSLVCTLKSNFFTGLADDASGETMIDRSVPGLASRCE